MADDDKRELREERVAIMMHLGRATEDEAENYCNLTPELYGYKEVKKSGKILEQG